MRPIITTLLAIDAGGKVIGNPSVVQSSAGEEYPAMDFVRALFRAVPAAVKVEMWRHGRQVDEHWRDTHDQWGDKRSVNGRSQ